jgi:hypothetical protein
VEEEAPFLSVIKVVTRHYGLSNDPADAGRAGPVDSGAPAAARVLLLNLARFVTVGNATFLVGSPEVTWPGLKPTAGADNGGQLLEASEVWVPVHEVISIVEEL